MNKISFFRLAGIAGVLGMGLVSCGKQESRAGKGKAGNRELVEVVTVEGRADGLAYLPGAAGPFTGAAVSAHPDAPWLVKLREPYTDGKRDGDKVELYKSGRVKSLRRYEMGAPKYHALYHKDGKMKLEANLNAADKCEGPYKRWYDDGMLEATASFDAEERWHGEFKEWTRTGELKTHHVFRHGLLVETIFESPESAAARKAIGLEVQRPAVTPSAE